MKILILGSTGQLGQEIINNFSNNQNDYKLIIPTREELNLTDVHACYEFVLNSKPDWIINTAAYTAVDDAEDNKELALLINSEAPKYLAKALKKTGGKILHLSTDYVFDGNQNYPWEPFQEPNPLNTYGKTKYLGEQNILKELKDSSQCIILRTSWIISPVRKNFALTILKLCKSRQFINVINDQYGTPTSTNSLSKICSQVIQKDQTKFKLPHILHWSDYGTTNWYEIACETSKIALKLGLINKKAKIIPIKTSAYSSKAKRPLYSVLDSKCTCEILGVKQVKWDNSLYEILEKIKYNY